MSKSRVVQARELIAKIQWGNPDLGCQSCPGCGAMNHHTRGCPIAMVLTLLDPTVEMVLSRKWFTDNSTKGVLSLDGVFECFTLEDRSPLPGEPKAPGATAIPVTGDMPYPVEFSWSPRFQRRMLGVQNVLGFAGIRFHAGNSARDTEGCILVGVEPNPGTDLIGRSRVALRALEMKIGNSSATLRILEEPIVDTRTPRTEGAP